MKTVSETIAAVATPPGRGGVAIVRISGPLVQSIAEKILNKIPKPRLAHFSVFLDEKNNPIDEGIALFFTAPNSFTGEDVLELHCHGGPFVVDQLLKCILFFGARLAKPGEFSERAFLNDKMDLAQAEAIADLIDAQSIQAAQSALRSLQGEFSKKIHQLVASLIQVRTYIEAAIDFAEEEIDFLANEEISKKLTQLIREVEIIQSQASQGSLLREGIHAVIAGKPNVGKSSLLNALSEKEIAIVTHIAGTTRDVLREHLSIDGIPMHIIDTAGLRESDDPVEQEGMRRAREEISRADIILLVTDAATKDELVFSEKISEKAKVILIRNKIDLLNEKPAIKEQRNQIVISLSAKNNLGIDLLKQKIKNSVGFVSSNEGIFSARRRHLEALNRAQSELIIASEQLTLKRAGELVAENLRQAQLALNEITGEFTSDDLLGNIFSSFCIGK